MKHAAASLLALLATVATAADGPRVRVTFEPRPPVAVGQPLRMHVTVLAPNFFTAPPAFPAIEIPNAIVSLVDERAQLGTETIGGTTYSLIGRTYTITAQHAGAFTLPPAKISFRYAAVPGRPGVGGQVSLPALAVTVRESAGAESKPAITANLKQTLDPDPRGLKTGDALTRTLEVYAAGIAPMMITPPEFSAPAGVRVYGHTSQLNEVKGQHDEFLGGRRLDRATYVFERAGEYTLPAIEIRWRDPQGREHSARAEAIKLTVAAGTTIPGIAPEAEPANQPQVAARPRIDLRSTLTLAAAIAGMALMFWLVRRFGIPLLASWRTRRRRTAESEDAYFRRALAACRKNEPLAAYDTLVRWARRTGAGSLRALASAEPELRTEATRLESVLFGPGPSGTVWRGHALAAAARAARTALHASKRSSPHASALPPLNPWSTEG